MTKEELVDKVSEHLGGMHVVGFMKKIFVFSPNGKKLVELGCYEKDGGWVLGSFGSTHDISDMVTAFGEK